MLSYSELTELGYCPKGFKMWAILPEGYPKPDECPHEIFKQMPLQLQVMYNQYPEKSGNHLRNLA